MSDGGEGAIAIVQVQSDAGSGRIPGLIEGVDPTVTVEVGENKSSCELLSGEWICYLSIARAV